MPLDVTLLQQPYELSFSGNPLPFGFAISPYRDSERAADIRLQVRVLVAVGGTFREVKSQTFYPDYNGQVSLDVSSYVDPYLSYYLPRPSLAVPVLASGQVAQYKLSYTLLRGSAIAVAAQESIAFTVIKGGMSYDEWHPSAFFTDYLFAQKNFLSFSATGEKAALEELRFLYFLAPAAGTYIVRFSVLNDVGNTTNIVLSQSITASQYSLWCIPAGYNQVVQPSGSTPTWCTAYSVQVLATGNVVAASRTYTTDYRKVYDAYQILYRNSAGGLETIRLRGQADFEADYDRQQARRTVPPAYFGRGTVAAALTDTADESPKYKADTGFLSKAAADKLRDLFLSPEKWEWDGRKLLPISLLSKSTKFFSNRDSLISILVEWQRAYTNAFYTPAGTISPTQACPAVANLVVKQVGRDKLQIMYALAAGYNIIQVEVLIGSGSYPYTYSGNTGSVLQSFANPAALGSTASITIKARTVCDEEAGSYSAYTTLPLTVSGNNLPVVANDTYNVEAGSGPYTLGSILENDSDPDGDPIEAVPRIAATAKGGLYDLKADGTFRYGPPVLSPAFSGQDYFDVEVREAGSTTTITGRVFINVGMAAGVVYAKLVQRNLQTGGASGYPLTVGEVWLEFYSNAAGTQPLNVSGMGVTFNVRDRYRILKNSNGSVVTDTNTDKSFAGTGTQLKVYEGILSLRQPGQTEEHLISLLPGSGYTAI